MPLETQIHRTDYRDKEPDLFRENNIQGKAIASPIFKKKLKYTQQHSTFPGCVPGSRQTRILILYQILQLFMEYDGQSIVRAQIMAQKTFLSKNFTKAGAMKIER